MKINNRPRSFSGSENLCNFTGFLFLHLFFVVRTISNAAIFYTIITSNILLSHNIQCGSLGQPYAVRKLSGGVLALFGPLSEYTAIGISGWLEYGRPSDHFRLLTGLLEHLLSLGGNIEQYEIVTRNSKQLLIRIYQA